MARENEGASSVEGASHPGAISFLRGPIHPQTWREFGYVNLALLLTPLAFTYAVFSVSLTVGIAVTVIGLLIGGGLIVGSRGWGAMYRALDRELLGGRYESPEPFVWPKGFWRKVGATLGDGTGWRALLFLALTLPLHLASFIVSWTVLASSLGAITHAAWRQYLPEQRGWDGQLHRGASFGSGYFVDTPPRLIAFAVAGVVLLFLWPQIQRLILLPTRILGQVLLARSAQSKRVADLHRARGRTVSDADARLRRIERDLHDGTQAGLVAIAMQLGEARERLHSTGGDAQAVQLVDGAHQATKDVLVDLRELARGIRPPALDAGLAVALETLAARTGPQVRVRIGSPLSAHPSIETIAYFCAAELVTNATKYAPGSRVLVDVEQTDQGLWLRVHDDGQGGAVVAPPAPDGTGSGLWGLADRVWSVDGTLDVRSPAGGPTVITVALPLTIDA